MEQHGLFDDPWILFNKRKRSAGLKTYEVRPSSTLPGFGSGRKTCCDATWKTGQKLSSGEENGQLCGELQRLRAQLAQVLGRITRALLVAPGITTSNKKLLVTKGIAARSKDARKVAI